MERRQAGILLDGWDPASERQGRPGTGDGEATGSEAARSIPEEADVVDVVDCRKLEIYLTKNYGLNENPTVGRGPHCSSALTSTRPPPAGNEPFEQLAADVAGTHHRSHTVRDGRTQRARRCETLLVSYGDSRESVSPRR